MHSNDCHHKSCSLQYLLDIDYIPKKCNMISSLLKLLYNASNCPLGMT